ncbi:GNAT family N-acetyltransferase [Ostreiculturibacter nitratireducens]|uniref:GNAT family N-acetyltransferase n=1 Tax=Ostreiculturibacter nitratireducens TaxID=3075226 RepID=UPI0031B567D8
MRPDDLTIRPLAQDDEHDWRRLWTAYLDFYKTRVPEEVYRTTFARLLSGDPWEFNGLVAEQGGKLVGLAHYLFHRTCWKLENVCYLQDLFCDPERRGRGIGRSLIEAVYAEADKHGAPGVWWLTQEHNYMGRMLYDKVGVKTPFIRYSRHE